MIIDHEVIADIFNIPITDSEQYGLNQDSTPSFEQKVQQLHDRLRRLFPPVEWANQPPDLIAAMRLAERGFAVFPIWPNGKAPACPDGCESASTDPEIIAQLWEGRKLLNVGVEASRSNLVLLDVDAKAGRNGNDALAKLTAIHGSLPPTLMATTPNGGTHYYFRRPTAMKISNRKDAPWIGDGLEVRANNQYVVAPPSRIGERSYEWIDENAPLADCPQWLADLTLNEPPRIAPEPPKNAVKTTLSTDKLENSCEYSSKLERARKYAAKVPGAADGNRNNAAFSLAGHLWSFEIREDQVMTLLFDWNERCRPPLEVSELEAVVRSARKNGTPRPLKNDGKLLRMTATAKQSAEHTDGLPQDESVDDILIDLETIEAKPINWLWANRIPRGMLTLISGDDGLSKSTLTFDLAARISSGSPLPDGSVCQEGKVILVSGEDALAETIVPRLQVAGAKMQNVKAWNMGKKYFQLQDIATLDHYLTATRAAAVFIDPVAAFLGNRDSHKDADIRELLAPLSDLASKHGTAIILVAHHNKSINAKAAQRVSGSVAFRNAVRMQYIVTADPTDCDMRLFIDAKNNIGPRQGTLRYKLIQAAHAISGSVVKLEWQEGTVDITADQALGANAEADATKGREAAAYLEDRLSAGPVASDILFQEAEGLGISKATLYRAKDKLSLKAEKHGYQGKWRWSLNQPVSDASLIEQTEVVEGSPF